MWTRRAQIRRSPILPGATRGTSCFAILVAHLTVTQNNKKNNLRKNKALAASVLRLTSSLQRKRKCAKWRGMLR